MQIYFAIREFDNGNGCGLQFCKLRISVILMFSGLLGSYTIFNIHNLSNVEHAL